MIQLSQAACDNLEAVFLINNSDLTIGSPLTPDYWSRRTQKRVFYSPSYHLNQSDVYVFR